MRNVMLRACELNILDAKIEYENVTRLMDHVTQEPETLPDKHVEDRYRFVRNRVFGSLILFPKIYIMVYKSSFMVKEACSMYERIVVWTIYLLDSVCANTIKKEIKIVNIQLKPLS